MTWHRGLNALDKLAAEWALHDGAIRGVKIESDLRSGLVMELTCTPRSESPVEVAVIRFEGVKRFDVAWDDREEFLFVPGYKAAMLQTGAVYFSLDPFDDRVLEADERDAWVIEAARISVHLTMKEPGQ